MTRPRRAARGARLVGLLCALLALMAFAARTAATASTASVGWLHTAGSTILDARDRTHTIKAVSWFGMETDLCVPHGLGQIELEAGMAQIASFGFNTVRLPFSNACLAAHATSSVDLARNPALAGLTALQVMDLVVARAEAHGLSVILDRHRPGSDAQSELWYTPTYPESRWIADWTMLAKRYADTPTVIAVDLHNEPHGNACWGCGDLARDWAAAATRAGNAVLAVNPRLLVVVEGVERQADGQAAWWGGSLADVTATPVTLDVPGRVVYSPHDYPASIYPQSYFSDPTYPANLDALWTARWGYLAQQDIAPVLLGEFGTQLVTASDRQWLDRLVGYLGANDISFAYWSFNPDSGDTGGLVADDWVTPQTAKLRALEPLLGGSQVPGPAPTTALPTSAAPTSAAPTTPAPSVTSTPEHPAPDSVLTATWRPRASWAGGYVAEVVLRAPGPGRTGWAVQADDPAAVSVVNAWGMTCAVNDGKITCTGRDWGASVRLAAR